MAKLVNGGKTWVLDELLRAGNDLILGLYTNDTEPADAAVLGDLTQPSGNGYATKTLTGGSWSVSGNDASYAEQEFTASGGSWGAVYGYFIADGATLLAVESFKDGETPINFTIGDGSALRVTPKLTAN